jgi:transposase
MADLPQVTVGMEACGGAHEWARQLRNQGHDVKLMAPQYVKPYVKTNKNDRRDAEAIAEAVTRPSMRFVPIKTVEQQDVQALHRVRERLMGARTGLINEMRGLLERVMHFIRSQPLVNRAFKRIACHCDCVSTAVRGPGMAGAASQTQL